MKDSDVLKAVVHSGLNPLEKSEILYECAENKFDALKDGTTEEFAGQLSDKRIVEFLNLIKGAEFVDHATLIELGNLLREYGKSSERPKKLNQKEIEVIDLGVSLLNKWYPSGIKDFAGIDSNKNTDSLAAVAFLVNQLAKIRLIQNGEAIEDLDKEDMLLRIDGTKETIEEYFDNNNLKKRLVVEEGESSRINSLIEERKGIEAPVSIEIANLKKQALPTVLSEIETLRTGSEEYLNIISMFVNSLKTNNARVLEFMIRSDVSLGIAWDKIGDHHTMGQALDKTKKLSADERKRVMLFSEIKVNSDIVERASTLNLTNPRQDQNLDDMQILSADRVAQIRDIIKNRESIVRDVEMSLAMFRKSIVEQRAGGFYGLKTLLVSLKMMIDEARSGSESIDFYSKRLVRDRSKGDIHTFSFYDNDMTTKQAWYKMHVKRNHILGASFVVKTILEDANNK